MTCIVGIEFNNKVYIGGDLLGSNGFSKIIHTQPKVFKVGDLLFGYTTSYRFGQIIEHYLSEPFLPAKNADIYKWLCTKVVPDIRNILEEHWDEEKISGECLIGIKNELWHLESNFAVLRSVKGYDACGSGKEFAEGVLYALQNTLTKEDLVKKAIKTSIEAASEHGVTVGRDSVIMNTEI